MSTPAHLLASSKSPPIGETSEAHYYFCVILLLLIFLGPSNPSINSGNNFPHRGDFRSSLLCLHFILLLLIFLAPSKSPPIGETSEAHYYFTFIIFLLIFLSVYKIILLNSNPFSVKCFSTNGNA